MEKRPPILVDRRRSWLLILVVSLSFLVHLSLIAYFANEEPTDPSEGPTVIEVALIGGGGGGAPPMPTPVPRRDRPARVAPNAVLARENQGKPDVILPGRPSASPSPRPSPRPTMKPTPKPSPKPTAKPKPTAAPSVTRSPATPSPKPTAKPTPLPTPAALTTTTTRGRPAAAKGVRPLEDQAATPIPGGVVKPAVAQSPLAVTADAARRAAQMSRSLDKARARTTGSEDASVGGTGGARGGLSSGGNGPGTGGDGVGGPVRPPAFMAYYSLMLDRIRDAWVWAGRRPDLSVTVGFGISAQGVLSQIRVVKASSDPGYDASVLRALRAVRVLPAPPTAFRRDFGDVELVFRPADLGRARR